MRRVLIYSLLLMAGMALSQLALVDPFRPILGAVTMIFLAYIMVEVGMEFSIDKSRLNQYVVDYMIAMGAAAVPWVCAAVYFWWVFGLGAKEALLVGRFASPTSAGILFTMLAAAGLAATWVYKKARVLAIFDDLDTVLLMIPLKMWLVGFQPKLVILILLILALLAVSYFCIHWLRVPTGNAWVALYGVGIWAACFGFDHITELHLEVLLPAFAFGCIVKSDHLHGSAEYSPQHAAINVQPDWEKRLDHGIKAGFMLLAGMALPPIPFELIRWATLLHVLLLTLLTNVGKCVPLAAYRKEATPCERLALSVGMFPRGEVGIGVLLVSLEIFRQQDMLAAPAVQTSIAVGGLSLAFNLLLTGVFILGVIRLLERSRVR
jgi:Kef-type K+ transport system membrane component KefB